MPPGNRKAEEPTLIGAEAILTPVPTNGVARTAVAAAPTCFGVENVIVGELIYPLPTLLTVTTPTPPVVEIPDVPAAPEPPPPVNLILGAVVYPVPGFTNATC